MGLDKTAGLSGADPLYEKPLNARDDSMSLFARLNQSNVIDGEFKDLDIESHSQTLGVTFKHFLTRTRRQSFDLFASLERCKSESLLLGDGFSFSPGPENGVSRLTVLRSGHNFQFRSPTRVVAARTSLNIGVNAFNATVHNDDQPDAESISLLLQGQWAERFALWYSTLISRLDIQLTDSPLLGLEQLAVGGYNSVRGYRENSLVRDQGGIA